MSTQQIRNLFNTQIDSVLVMAKKRIKDESKKKLEELKEQMPTPPEIQKKLLADINEDNSVDIFDIIQLLNIVISDTGGQY